MRFHFLILVLLTFFCYGNENKVYSSSGIVNGVKISGVMSWDDIPYAKPPLGELRWKAPRKLDPSSKNNLIKPQEDNFCVQEPSGLGVQKAMVFFGHRRLLIS